jgi:HD-GYP domain-containing protein (c-di-GMP phosphodiesterase class II)
LISIASLLKKADRKGKDLQDEKKKKKPSSQPDRSGASVLPLANVSRQQHRTTLKEEYKSTTRKELTDEPSIPNVIISPTVNERDRILDREESSSMYRGAVQLSETIHKQALSNESPESKPIHYCVDKLIGQLMLHNKHLLEFTDAADEQYQYAHAVHVCMLSVKTAIGLGYDREHLKEIGVLAYVHDIGMNEYTDLVGRPLILSKKKHRDLKKHYPFIASQIEKAHEISDMAFDIALQEHSAAGHNPDGLINLYRQIISLADLYETAIHLSLHRDAVMPFKVMQGIITMKSLFDYRLMKTFIDVVGIFPMGSIVRLNTDEIGTVTGINTGFPTRPVLKVMYDRHGSAIAQKKVIDLTKQKAVYITGCLNAESVPGHSKR